MSDPGRDRRRRATDAILRGVVFFVVAVTLIYFGVPFALHWYGCQQLAPIERVFTRGC